MILEGALRIGHFIKKAFLDQLFLEGFEILKFRRKIRFVLPKPRKGQQDFLSQFFIADLLIDFKQGAIIVLIGEHRLEFFEGIEFEIQVRIVFFQSQKIIVPSLRREDCGMLIKRMEGTRYASIKYLPEIYER